MRSDVIWPVTVALLLMLTTQTSEAHKDQQEQVVQKYEPCSSAQDSLSTLLRFQKLVSASVATSMPPTQPTEVSSHSRPQDDILLMP